VIAIITNVGPGDARHIFSISKIKEKGT